jgi:predicted AAA+ superfamily ATPase
MRTEATDAIDEYIRAALEATYGLTLLSGVLADDTAQAVLHLLSALSSEDPSSATIARAYSRAFNALARAVNTEEIIPGFDDAWQAYLLTRIIDDINPWSMQAERVGAIGIATGIQAQAQRDLRTLRLLFDLTAKMIWQTTRNNVTPSLPALHDVWVPWYELTASQQQQQTTAREILAHEMAEYEDWSSLVDTLTAHWARQGTGQFARYHVLRWQGHEQYLRGIAHPDPIRLAGLISYEREQAILKTNTERFLQGLPAHDAVLYGAPGTGKSSTVKALANTYAGQGLRLVEVRKDAINDLPEIVAQLRGRAPHFLLFIDDLSFEDYETEYKALKVLLEGTTEARPKNVLIYVTSNRLNLVRENFSDRGKPSDDVHWRDTMEEKNSLVARFGLRVTFALPNQERYLKIAAELARQRGIDLTEDDLRARALSWEHRHVGRSGRMARQFVDELEAELREFQKQDIKIDD